MANTKIRVHEEMVLSRSEKLIEIESPTSKYKPKLKK